RFLKPFGCHVMILNTLDNLGKFKVKGDKVDAGTNSTNLSGTKDAANQEVKKNESSLRYILLPNWAHDALLEPTSRVSTSSDEIIGVEADPPGFHDPAYPAKVYKVEKAMYGLHQAPRAWYGTLSKYMLKNGFQRGIIDQTLFIRREFEALMREKFQMSGMGELNFFFGLQVLQKEDGIFLSQD
nr:putative ribonuclease H-like domain-containing protein [Tanacetum cinerariifolium]